MADSGPAAATALEKEFHDMYRSEALAKKLDGVLGEKKYAAFASKTAEAIQIDLDRVRGVKEKMKATYTPSTETQFKNLIKKCAYLEALIRLKQEHQTTSKSWLFQAVDNQEEAEHLSYVQGFDPTRRSYHDALIPSALLRGPQQSFGHGSRGQQMQQHATRPNPSTQQQRPGSTGGTVRWLANAAVGAVGVVSNVLGIGSPREELLCVNCNTPCGTTAPGTTISICARCLREQDAAAERPPNAAGAAAMQRQQAAGRTGPKPVESFRFGGAGTGYHQPPAKQPRLGKLDPVDYPKYNTHDSTHPQKAAPLKKGRVDMPALPMVRSNANGGPVGGGAQVLAPAPRARPPPQPRRSKQAQQQQQQLKDQDGTADNPIEIGDSDDEGPGAAGAAGAGIAAAGADPFSAGAGPLDEDAVVALRGAEHAAKAEARKTRRAAAGAAAAAGGGMAALASRLRGLRCQMPPSGGLGSVEFTAADLLRLDRDEFLNDTAIDFYLRWVRCELERTNPELARRCYFFNSFFYKKLTEKVKDAATGAEVRTLLKKTELNFHKVAKWTRGVDIFSKDYLFVPIHDHLHWSLVIVCHPGAPPGVLPPSSSKGRKRPGSAGSAGRGVVDLTGGGSAPDGTPSAPEEDPRLRPTANAFIIHLDSLEGGHRTPVTVLKTYLECEWNQRAQDSKTPSDWVPATAAASGNAERSFKSLEFVKPSIPVQDNHCDCGLFVCAYVEFFTAALPPALSLAAVQRLRDDGEKDGVDLWEGHETAHYPGFLTKHWFRTENGSALRWELAHMALRGMGQNAGLMDAYDAFCTEVATKPEKEVALRALMDGIDLVVKAAGEYGGGYVRPVDWRLQAEQDKADRAVARAVRLRRQAEDLERQKAERVAKAAAGDAVGARDPSARAGRGQNSRRQGGMVDWSDDDVFDDDEGPAGGGGGGGGGTTSRKRRQTLHGAYPGQKLPDAFNALYLPDSEQQDGGTAAAAVAVAAGVGAQDLAASRKAAEARVWEAIGGQPPAVPGGFGAAGAASGGMDGVGSGGPVSGDPMDWDGGEDVHEVIIDDVDDTMDVDVGPVTGGSGGPTAAPAPAPAPAPGAPGDDDSDVEIVEDGKEAPLPEMDDYYDASLSAEAASGAAARRIRPRPAPAPTSAKWKVPDYIKEARSVELRLERATAGGDAPAVSFEMTFRNQPVLERRAEGAGAWDRVYTTWFLVWEFGLPFDCRRTVPDETAVAQWTAAAAAWEAGETVPPSAPPSVEPTEQLDIDGEEAEEADGGVMSAPRAAPPGAAAADADVINLADEGEEPSPAKKKKKGNRAGRGVAVKGAAPAPSPSPAKPTTRGGHKPDYVDSGEGETPRPKPSPKPKPRASPRGNQRKQAQPKQVPASPRLEIPKGPRTQHGAQMNNAFDRIQAGMKNAAGKGKGKGKGRK